MSKLNIEEWTKITERFTELNESTDLSPGKSYFKALEEIKPDLHSKLEGTDKDSSKSENNLITLLYYLNEEDK